MAHTGLPGEITPLTVDGVRVAFLGFAPYEFDANLLDIAGAKRLVRRARKIAPIVVVIIHAGAEGADAAPHPTRNGALPRRGPGQRASVRARRDRRRRLARVRLWAPCDPGVERYRGRLIAYSLGDFVGYHTLGDQGVLSQSAILRVRLGIDGRLLAARWISIRLVNGLPRPEPSEQSARLVARLSSEDFASHFVIGPDGVFRLPRASLG